MNDPVRPDEIRIADADRQAVADRLRAAHDDGYIDLSEFDERIADVWRMRTRGDLERVTRDLPAARSRPRPDGILFAATPGGVAMRVLSLIWLCVTAAAAAGSAVLALLIEDLSPLWFLMVSAPPGAVLLCLWSAGVGRRRRGDR
ncbi:DUF1707 SHOCT-like domain-containing protein [Pseudonocardia sp. HH130630-07]|uniref:DUF1707 SHOCT-like domain-containing protein n=1 Tax=Pseudonocardia sp. HH130630-07 TaxID=1690815 RepID=UPI000814CCA1|nr:DUF1707 domain-containing protein [Pseudonocardia sp. HH130630-07]ANY06472.1 hypothetical protein AFB00_09400 [Pseudonocardia sp. HH130630-07]